MVHSSFHGVQCRVSCHEREDRYYGLLSRDTLFVTRHTSIGQGSLWGRMGLLVTADGAASETTK